MENEVTLGGVPDEVLIETLVMELRPVLEDLPSLVQVSFSPDLQRR